MLVVLVFPGFFVLANFEIFIVKTGQGITIYVLLPISVQLSKASALGRSMH